jgi:DNA processing protein
MYFQGKVLKSDKFAVAVVGSRLMTPRGKSLTEKFVKELVKNKVTIVSGLARGIDTVAHKTALDNGGRTIAVLGSGLDIIYPPENAELAKSVSENGALVSPFANGTKPIGKNFLARNRVIVSLSLAVLVIEGARRSGTLSTASWAANSGVEVFAIPGSPATDWLLEQGASIANDPADVIQYLKANAANYS